MCDTCSIVVNVNSMFRATVDLLQVALELQGRRDVTTIWQ